MTDNKHWLRLIVKTPPPVMKRNTKYYNTKHLPDKEKHYPLSGKFSEYGEMITTWMGW